MGTKREQGQEQEKRGGGGRRARKPKNPPYHDRSEVVRLKEGNATVTNSGSRETCLPGDHAAL